MSEKQTPEHTSTPPESAEENPVAGQVPPGENVAPSDDTSAADDLEAALADADASRQTERLSLELAEAKAHTLRAQAELENFRKRMRREMEQEQRYAALPVLSDLLPVVDNLQRAVSAAGESQESSGLVEGVKMVVKHLASVLEKHHCVSINPVGEAFDPNLHEAIAQQPSDSQEPGTVLHVTQIGYKVHDRVVRPAQVVVAAEPSGEASPE